MSKFMLYTIFILCSWIVLGYIAGSTARSKNRDELFWFIMGMMFGPFAILTVALLPKKSATKRASRRMPKAMAGATEVHSEASVPFDEGATPPPLPPRLRIPTSKDIKWYFLDEQAQQIGPVKINDLRKMALEKQLNADTYVWHGELADWTQIKDFTNCSVLFDPDFLEE